ncbi:SdrD B-like domain-containing protein, partial [Neolewinella aurantiaca]
MSTNLSAQVVVSASASCNDELGMNAGANTYYVVVNDVTNDTASMVTTFDVTVGTETLPFTPGVPIVFGPFSHSGAGGAVQIITATDNSNAGASGTAEVPEVLCGVRPDGGQASGGFCMTTTDPDVLTGAILAQSAPGSFMAGGSSGQVQTYVLVDDAGFIVQSNMTGLFENLPSNTYQVFAVNYRETEDLDNFLLPGESFQPLLDAFAGTPTGTSLDNACFTICDTDPVIMVPVNCLSIGSTVFTDNDNDGMYTPGAGETGIEGVDVNLYAVSSSGLADSLVATTTTDAMGNYFFGGLDEGMYTVSIPTTPEGYPLSSTDDTPPEDVATGDDVDSGIQDMTGDSVVSPVITLMAQTEPTGADEAGAGGMQDDDIVGTTTTSNDDANGDMTVDFGFVPSMSIGSTVFYDTDNDGAQDLTDPLEGGIAGVTVILYDVNNMPIATTITDMNGNYLFDSLAPGTYFVGVEAPVDAQYASTGAGADTGANDTDGNSDGSMTTIPGDVSLSGPVELVFGMEPTGTDEDGQGNMQDDATPFADANGNMTVDFGFVPTNSVGSTVYFDMNDDGIQMGANEIGVEGVIVQLLGDPDGDGTLQVIATDTTDANGDYFFPNLPDGDYQVVLPNGVMGGDASSMVSNDPADGDIQNGTMQADGSISSDVFTLMAGDTPETELDGTTGDDQDADDPANGIVDANGNMTIDFGIVPTLSIGSTVFYDADNSGDQDTNDPLEGGIAGVTVNLYFDDDNDPGTPPVVIAMTVTDENGDYLFDSLAPGNYQVGVLAPDDAIAASTTQSVADDDIDGTNDGAQGAGAGAGSESLSGIVELSIGDEPQGGDEAGQGGEQDDTAPLSDANGNMTVDFGFIPVNSVGSVVFFDMNDDGIQMGANEIGVEGVTVDLLLDDDMDPATPPVVVATTMTDANGVYLFDSLPNGTYTISLPNGLDTGMPSSTVSNDPIDAAVQNGMVDGVNITSDTFQLVAGMSPIEPTDDNGDGQDEMNGLVDANGNMTIDFGIVPTLSLGSTVFYDADNSGDQDLNDPLEGGIAGVTVNLYFDDDNDPATPPVLIDMTITDADGNYLFDSLAPGDYQVGVITPESAPTVSTGPASDMDMDANDNTDGNNDGQPTPTGAAGEESLSGVVNLMPGEEPQGGDEAGQGGEQDDSAPLSDANGNMTVDFGLVPVNSVGSVVFFDMNDDGIQMGPNEIGVEGVTVDLLLDDDMDPATPPVVVATTMTDANGLYLFDSLPNGTYTISLPNGLNTGMPSSTVSNDPDNETVQNGMVDGLNITTDTFQLVAGMSPLETTDNNGDGQDEMNGLVDGNGNMTIDIGIVPTMSIGSTVFYDVDDSGDQDPANPLESGIAGATVNLYFDADGNGMIDNGEELTPIDMVVTDMDGNYLFDSLSPGVYVVGVVPADDAETASSTQSDADTDVDGTNDGMQMAVGGESLSGPFTLSPGDEPADDVETFQGNTQDDGANEENGNMTVDFGFIPLGSVGSTVYFDMNDNGMQDEANDVGIAGVTVQLFADTDGDGIPETLVGETLTDMDGVYLFDSLPNGTYTVVLPMGPDGGMTPSSVVDGDDTNVAVQNGTAQGDGSVASAPFDLVAGTEPIEGGNLDGDDQDNGGDDADGNMTIDFGFVPTMSIGSTVFYDVDDSGDQDPANPLESGIAGATVNLYFDADGNGMIDNGEELTPIDMVVTDMDGNYLFDSLSPGVYVVGVVPADDAETASSTQSDADTDVDGTNDGMQMAVGGESLSGPLTLSPGDEPADDVETFQGNTQDDGANEENGNMTVDFGFIPLGSVGSTVYFDMNDNGMQDEANDVGIAGVTVQLFADTDGDGIPETLVGETLTDMDGVYLFDSLPNGTYTVVLPMGPDGGMTPSSVVDGDDTNVAVQNGTAQGDGSVASAPFDLVAGTEPIEGGNLDGDDQDNGGDDADGNMTIDFGFVPTMSIGSTVFYDTNDDGEQDLTDPLEGGIAGVTVNLYFDDDNNPATPPVLIDMAITDADGNYLFDSLAPGLYQVGVVPATDAGTASAPVTDADTDVDGVNDGTQAGGTGTESLSGVFELVPGDEPQGGDEDGQGGAQDDSSPLEDGNGNMTIDFGFVPTNSLGSTVFVDYNDNGMQDAMETGVAGVEVQLLADTDGDGIPETVVATTVTNGNGDYFFPNLPDGNYQVVLPNGVEDAVASTPVDPTTTDAGLQNGTMQPDGSISSQVIMLMAGDAPETELDGTTGDDQDADDPANNIVDDNGNMTIDFGVVPEFSLGSTVFEDTNNNATQDAGEAGVPDVEVTLYEDTDMSGDFSPGDMVVATTTTDMNGDYFFDGLPAGDYLVGILPTEDLPLSSDDTLDEDDADTTPVDGDDNGTQSDGAGSPIYTGVVTLGDGPEPADNVEVGQGGTQDGVDGSQDDLSGNMTLDLGLFPGLSVGSTVFNDPNNNGMQDAGETGIPGVVVTLLDDMNNVIATDTTDSAGDYFFGGLPEGMYQISIAADQFAPGGALEDSSLSSGPTSTADDETDGDDNGTQVTAGAVTTSPVFELSIGDEPTGAEEGGQGGLQDGDDYDANGDMTIDFGFLVPSFDLALIKVLSPGQTSMVNPGDTISYDIIVFNQGNIYADNIAITDMIPVGMTFDATNNADFAADGTVTLTAGGLLPSEGLAPGASDTVSLSLVVDVPVAAGTQFDNVANITMATDTLDVPQDDDDSDYAEEETPDDIDESDNDVIDENGEDPLNPGDEDESDEETITVRTFDLALTKTLSAGQTASVAPGDTVSFDIIVFNQGEIAADNIDVVDFVPDGYTFDATLNSDWTATGAGAMTSLSVAEMDLPVGGLLPGASDTVQILLTVNNPQLPGTMDLRNIAEIMSSEDPNGNEQIDVDSDYTDGVTPDVVEDIDNDDITEDGTVPGEDEDESDFEEVTLQVFDLALIKMLSPMQDMSVEPGDTIAYTITVINQGDIPADNIEVTDYLPAELGFEMMAGNGVDDNSTLGWSLVAGNPTTTLTVADGELPAGGLAPGASVSIDLFLTLTS